MLCYKCPSMAMLVSIRYIMDFLKKNSLSTNLSMCGATRNTPFDQPNLVHATLRGIVLHRREQQNPQLLYSWRANHLIPTTSPEICVHRWIVCRPLQRLMQTPKTLVRRRRVSHTWEPSFCGKLRYDNNFHTTGVCELRYHAHSSKQTHIRQHPNRYGNKKHELVLELNHKKGFRVMKFKSYTLWRSFVRRCVMVHTTRKLFSCNSLLQYICFQS